VALSSKSDAQTSPFQPGDKILSLNGVKDPTWEQAAKAIKEEAPGSPLSAEVENGGVQRKVQTTLGDSASSDRLLGYPPLLPVLDEVSSRQPRRPCRLKEGDAIQSVDGQKFSTGTIRRPRSRFGWQASAARFAAQWSSHSHASNARSRCDRIRREIYQVGVAVRDQTSYRREGLSEGVHDALVMNRANAFRKQ